MDASKDFYAILGVLASAEDVVIHAAYRALAQRYHPDRFDGSPAEANARMAEINEAHAVLSDATARAEYDRLRATQPGGAGMPSSGDDFARTATANAEIEVFRPFAEKLHEFGYDAPSIAAVLVARGMRKASADYLARLIAAAGNAGAGGKGAGKLIGD